MKIVFCQGGCCDLLLMFVILKKYLFLGCCVGGRLRRGIVIGTMIIFGVFWGDVAGTSLSMLGNPIYNLFYL